KGVDYLFTSQKVMPGILLSIMVSIISINISELIPNHIIGASVLSLLLGMILNPLVSRYPIFVNGLTFTSKKILKFAIILMGASLSFTQVVQVGKFSLIVMTFTLVTAFGFGYILGRVFKMD